MNVWRHIILGAVVFSPFAAEAMDIKLPTGAKLVAESIESSDSYRIAAGSWKPTELDTVAAEGRIAKQAWRITSSNLTTLDLLSTLRDQLLSDGYSPLFECETAACGGFDFRFAIDVFPEPTMHVDMGDFRYFAAKREIGDAPEFVSIVVSKSASAGYVQIVHAGGDRSTALPLTTSTKGSRPTQPVAPGNLVAQLEVTGHFVLEDLNYATGSSQLADGEYATLAALADYLETHPERTIALVGHTDAEGSLSNNVALSKKRASSVARLLVDKYGVKQSQITAEGMGFLSPRASNLTEEGRAQNRRVEVILTSTDG